MEPIISPWWFYLFDVCGGLEFVSFAIISIVMLISVPIIIITLSEEEFDILKKYAKIPIILITISITLSLLIPSKQTMYAMLGTNYLTPNNIEMVGNSVEDCVDYIFDKIDELDENKGEN